MADSDVEIVTEVKTNQSYPYDWLLHIDHLQKSNIETRVIPFFYTKHCLPALYPPCKSDVSVASFPPFMYRVSHTTIGNMECG